MLVLLKGSDSLVDASRHTIVLMPAKRGDYSNVQLFESDTAMMTAVKANVPRCQLHSGMRGFSYCTSSRIDVEMKTERSRAWLNWMTASRN